MQYVHTLPPHHSYFGQNGPLLFPVCRKEYLTGSPWISCWIAYKTASIQWLELSEHWVCSLYQYFDHFVDLGGASAQITFVPQEAPKEGSYSLIFTDTLNYELYGHSFLGYGNDQARDAVNQELCASAKDKSNVSNPCYPLGYSMQFNYQNTTCTINGASDYSECYSLSVKLLNKNAPCAVPDCSFDGVYQPAIPTSQVFIAFASYYYLYDFHHLPSNATLNEVVSKNEYFCNLTWAEIQHMYANSSNDFLMQYCFMGTYIVAVSATAWSIFNALSSSTMDLDFLWTSSKF